MQVFEFFLQAIGESRQVLALDQRLHQLMVRHILDVHQLLNKLMLVENLADITKRPLDTFLGTRLGGFGNGIRLDGGLSHPAILGNLLVERLIFSH